MSFDLAAGQWLNPPLNYQISSDNITLVTEPRTNLWQRSYYGTRSDNAPAYLFSVAENFSFTLETSFSFRNPTDQCGVLIYIDSENWFKAMVECGNETVSRLGSVVTNYGYSDWATTDIQTTSVMWYRLSRRGPDFLIEAAADGQGFQQMRIFHLHKLGETNAEMGKFDFPLPADRPIRFGLYACSPKESSFKAGFRYFQLEPCLWQAG